MFSSRSFIVSGHTLRSLIHFEFVLCMVLESVLVLFFYKWLTRFPRPLVKEIVFNPLYILASVKDKVSIGVWIYLWDFCFVSLIYVSVFVPPKLHFLKNTHVNVQKSFIWYLNRIYLKTRAPFFSFLSALYNIWPWPWNILWGSAVLLHQPSSWWLVTEEHILAGAFFFGCTMQLAGS